MYGVRSRSVVDVRSKGVTAEPAKRTRVRRYHTINHYPSIFHQPNIASEQAVSKDGEQENKSYGRIREFPILEYYIINNIEHEIE
jgi:hypothetical protein